METISIEFRSRRGTAISFHSFLLIHHLHRHHLVRRQDVTTDTLLTVAALSQRMAILVVLLVTTYCDDSRVRAYIVLV